VNELDKYVAFKCYMDGMGVEELECFNKVLLSKQGWCDDLLDKSMIKNFSFKTNNP
jgi:hypothetical protein